MPYVWQIPKFVRSYLRYIWQSCFEKPDLEGIHFGHLDIHQNKLRMMALEKRYGFSSVLRMNQAIGML